MMKCPKCDYIAMVEQEYVWLCLNCDHIEQKDTSSVEVEADP